MKKLLLVFLTLVCVSCAKEGTYVPSENARADFNIEFLFECDGVKIYRFSYLQTEDEGYFNDLVTMLPNSYKVVKL